MSKNNKKKIILKSYLSPGDIMMLTSAVRDLHKVHSDKFEIDVDTSCHEIWENNPYITKLDPKDEDVEVIDVEYPIIHNSNMGAYHFIHGYRKFLEDKLDVKIPQGHFKPDIHISDNEKSWISQLEEMGIKDRFWIINAGGKFDFTAKWKNPDDLQKVIDHFKGKITFVQCGSSEHFHIPLKGTVNLVGKTDLRQMIRLMYHASGVLCGVTFFMHLAAGVESKHGLLTRPCVVYAGGREPSQWEKYPSHQYLHTNGSLSCCDNGGCWKSRCTKIGDGDKKDNDDQLCIYPVDVNSKLVKKSKFAFDFKEAKCLNMITPERIIDAIELYYNGDILSYESSFNSGLKVL